MIDEYKKRIGIPDNHTLELVSSDFQGARRGQDTDVYVYKELDANGKHVATYEVENSTSTHPPFGKTISHRKINDV